MKAVVFRGVTDIRLEEVPDPEMKEPTDAVVRITTSAICGTDLHMIRGTMPGMEPGTILGHEGVGVVEEVGASVRNLVPGDRVLVPSTIACGSCSYCRAGYTAQCDRANPNGRLAGTAFYGGPKSTGPFHGLQAEYARVPLAHVNLVKLPDEVSDDQAILVSDIFPTGWFGADLADVDDGDSVLVLGCGPVGQFAVASAFLRGATRVFAVDCVKDRLELARLQGAEVVDFEKEDPVEVVRELTDGIGADCAIDAVGVDACRAHGGDAAAEAEEHEEEFEEEVREISGREAGGAVSSNGELWSAGDGPSQALRWAVEGVAKAGKVAVIGVYPENDRFFPIGRAMARNLTLRLGNCNHLRYARRLVEMVRIGRIDPTRVITQEQPLGSAIEAYERFDRRRPGWTKVVLEV